MDNYDYLEGCLSIRQIIIIHSKFSTLNSKHGSSANVLDENTIIKSYKINVK